jgi:predicted nucleotidyltransferase
MELSLLDARLPVEQLRALCAEYPIRELAVFGSVLTDAFGEASDVDFLVEFESDAAVGFLTLAEIRERLSLIVGRPVDLIPKAGLKPLLVAPVLAAAQVIYAK